MPREDQHRVCAEDNEKFAEALDKTDQTKRNWAVVAAFYSALHYVEQFFVIQGTPCINHDDRRSKFKSDIRIRQAYGSYQYLADLSHDARYKCVLVPDKVYEKEVRSNLAAVKKQIEHALNQNPPLVVAERKVVMPAEPARPTPGNPQAK
jgi:hypothetical protein